MFKMSTSEKGITFIALVVTIIVLIILAGVSINLVLGDNGIITKSKEASDEYKKEEEKELLKLAIIDSQIGGNGYEEINYTNLQKALDKQFGKEKTIVVDNGNGSYTVTIVENKTNYDITKNEIKKGINWNEKMANAVAPNEQTKKDVIGIGTDGNPVNMDLWEYNKLEDGTYLLNDVEAIKEDGTRTAGYDINYIENGKIKGTIPQYIKTSKDNEFKPVTNINYLFYNTELSEAPVIPATVTSLRGTFNSCKKLTKMPTIPSGVKNMYGTFANAEKLEEITIIPEGVENMHGTFLGCASLKNAPKLPSSVKIISYIFSKCTKLEIAPEIPNGVITMQNSFYECTLLKKIPSIPDSVVNMNSTFENCSSLKNIPKISNSVTDMFATFRNCTSLETAPVIPNSVTVFCATFKGCSNLQGTIEINANITGVNLGEEYNNGYDYINCLVDATTNEGITLKVTGSCTILDKIVQNANNSKITL